MANKKRKRRGSLTPYARSQRTKKSLHEAVTRKENNENVRVIISQDSLQNLINLALKHGRTCPHAFISISNIGPKIISMNCDLCHKKMSNSRDEGWFALSYYDSIAAGAIAAGIGYSSLKTVFNTMEINFIAKKTYEKAEKRVGDILEQSMDAEFKKNNEAEKQLAIEAGDVIEVENNTYPFITAGGDGGWGKRFGKGVIAAIRYNHSNQTTEIKTTAKSLSEDIINVPAHILGCHTSCKAYFCKSIGSDSKEFGRFKNTLAGRELLLAFHRLANRSHRLIYNVTSNFAENFMSVMNKYISGKRVNYAQRGGYARRACAAVMAYNYGAFWLPHVFPAKNENEHSSIWLQAEKYFLKAKARGQTSTPQRGPFRKKKAQKSKANDSKDYGPEADQGKLSEAELQLATENLISRLQVTTSGQNKIQQDTIGQSFNDSWKYERRDRITASNCGRIFRLRDWTNNSSTLKALLYPTDLSKCENVKYGINLEPEAKSLYTFLNGVEVRECGLFVSLENGILAASPDGLIEDDGILEVKCITCPPCDVPKRQDKFLVRKSKENSELQLRRTHKYYYQVVMQLHVTGKAFCDFFVYHKPKDETEDFAYHLERIHKDAETEKVWNEMRPKLEMFFKEDMAAEIVDPLFPSKSRFRIPMYRKEAMESRTAEKVLKMQNIDSSSVPSTSCDIQVPSDIDSEVSMQCIA